MNTIEKLPLFLQMHLDRLSPVARKKVMRKVAVYLQQKTRANIIAQHDPDGHPWVTRKSNPKRPMFIKLRQNKCLRRSWGANTAKLGFYGPHGRIAKYHQFGLTQQLKYGLADYPKRELIGITDADNKNIKNIIIDSIGGINGF